MGRLIPAGTGGVATATKKIATDRDQVIIDQRRAEAEAALAAQIEAPAESADHGFAEATDGDER